MTAKDHLFIALDLRSTEEARDMVRSLDGLVDGYKIGLQLFPVGGVKLAHDLITSGKRVFLDFKLYDIGATVAKAVDSIKTIGAQFLTIHGDRQIVAAAAEARGSDSLKLLAVTVLTSMNEQSLAEMGYQGSVSDLVLQRARMSLEEGADGVIASAQEAERLRSELGHDFVIITPGVRSPGVSAHDQKRVTTPGDAITAGANHLVVGREVTQAADPRAAAQNVLDQIAAAQGQ